MRPEIVYQMQGDMKMIQNNAKNLTKMLCANPKIFDTPIRCVSDFVRRVVKDFCDNIVNTQYEINTHEIAFISEI